jgi:hypothetical protein
VAALRPFCDNKKCHLFDELVPDRVDMVRLALPDSDAKVMVPRHSYWTTRRGRIFLCDTCHGAVELLKP